MWPPVPQGSRREPRALPEARTYGLQVVATSDLTPRMRRVRVAGESLAGFVALPGQDVVLQLIDDFGHGVRRRYTIRNLDVETAALGERPAFDLDVVVHGHGPGSLWAQQVQVGEHVEVFGPRGKVPLPGAGWQLYVGDESAIPAIAEMAAALPASTTVLALLEIGDADDEQPVDAAAHTTLRWLRRGATPPGTADVLDAALADADLADGDRHACVFGEGRVVRRLRDQLLARGLRSEEISAKGYWNLGRTDRP